MISPKIAILTVLVSLLIVVYHRPFTTSIPSIITNLTIKTCIAANVSNSTTDAATRKALARKKFEGTWEVIRSELLARFEEQGMPVDAREWYKRVRVISRLVVGIVVE
jgi:hypothetical protein